MQQRINNKKYEYYLDTLMPEEINTQHVNLGFKFHSRQTRKYSHCLTKTCWFKLWPLRMWKRCCLELWRPHHGHISAHEKNMTLGSCPSQIITPSSLWTRLSQTNAKQIPKFPDFLCSDRFGFLARRGNFSASTGAGPAPCAKVALQNRGPLLGPWTRHAWLIRK